MASFVRRADLFTKSLNVYLGDKALKKEQSARMRGNT